MMMHGRNTKQAFLGILIMLFYATCLQAQDITELSDAFEKLNEDETFDAEKYLVRGEPNYTIVVYRKSSSDKQIIQIARNYRDFIICDSGKKLFLRTNSDSEGFPKLYLYDGLSGKIKNLGRFPDVCISRDGSYILSYIPRQKEQIVGTGILYSTSNMIEVDRYDFDVAIRNRYQQLATLSTRDFFELSYLYSDDMNGFEVLFDHYGEIGPLTFSGLITIRDRKFFITDRKNELLKLMGYK